MTTTTAIETTTKLHRAGFSYRGGTHASWREEFIYDMASLGIPFLAVQELLRRAQTLHTLAVKSCNYGLTPRDEKRRENVIARVQWLCRQYQLLATYQGDPRGACLRVSVNGSVREYAVPARG